MTKSAVVTTRLNAETLALVDKIVEAQGRSRSWFAERAIRRAAEAEAEFLQFVQEGIDAADRGDVLSQGEMERWFENRVAASARNR